ncbi:MAG: ABC transporter ATP-binding protein [Tenericutes bacterium GWC2_34_14]|jgi:ABC-2 type transport system ATP-binding protein|nr:MAG: ABC transporter ATP-binding protein [Tenericutes bacterium GWA2_35_7]OHE29544.1 MAG: ABC transporter ATP-binding protein [Tenericutes bacterium GWC2_34_14]OHE33808.1 MAG: ABC transporter ATP-binding protein [Tenericutes bacterium GWE2_34_108]OHE36535.1 MAG: ABC transporter ATP-binding protein [Tenericutes bacterium GWF1_35_14]OHE37746.1 MAG: ABC transporter ATP-binding protein [Tenericutes bacterium GWF2_35_184]OHE41640.1 MAG: ABC transporter ATP-binding protein [Tenericutes bacterium 
MSMIEIRNLTKDYGLSRGIFNIDLEVKKGEIFGFVGTNGSGKTTTIRNMMGFIRPDSGSVYIMDHEVNYDTTQIMRHIGYVPGEIAFPDIGDGDAFLKSQAEMMGLKTMEYAKYLINKFKLDTTANLKHMSKGMKQKTAIVQAFMAEPDILILDEPSTGLDPLMRETFVDVLMEARQRGATIFMSSHVFEEVEKTCDRVALLHNGKVLDIVDMKKIRHNEVKTYKVGFEDERDYQNYVNLNLYITSKNDKYMQVTVDIKDAQVNEFMKVLAQFNLKYIKEVKYTLKKYFLKKISEDNEK